jgi:hypothetical protein
LHLHGQGIGDTSPYTGRTIDEIKISFTNPMDNYEDNQRISNKIQNDLDLYPGIRYNRNWLDYLLSKINQNPRVANFSYSISADNSGGVVLSIQVTIREPGSPGTDKSGKSKTSLPLLYDKGGSFFRLRADLLAMHYSNTNAWYGQPDAMLNGNPLVEGVPAGKGYADWIEGFAHIGVSGIAPLGRNIDVYGAISTIVSNSVGDELFTDASRTYLGIEDAFVGIITGKKYENGSRFLANFSLGRQRFTLGDGFLLINTASNGANRAALQSNPRWSGDFVAKASFSYNTNLLQFFVVDPDELGLIDSGTQIFGVNTQTQLSNSLKVGLSYLNVFNSSFNYFTPDNSFSREGLNVYNARFKWQPKSPLASGPFVAGEAAIQRSPNFDMSALGYYGEVGYNFINLPWKPSLSYRYANFSGDDENTNRFERWDPLFSGGNGEQWVQGFNHFKVVQNTNNITHKIQLRLRPLKRLELLPQFWIFRAASLTNLGGNPALSFIQDKDYGSETNMTFKVFVSRKIYLQGHIAATFPGKAVKRALNHNTSNWWSTMLFIRYSL